MRFFRQLQWGQASGWLNDDRHVSCRAGSRRLDGHLDVLASCLNGLGNIKDVIMREIDGARAGLLGPIDAVRRIALAELGTASLSRRDFRLPAAVDQQSSDVPEAETRKHRQKGLLVELTGYSLGGLTTGGQHITGHSACL
jgi:hypothetical protein